MADVTHLHKLVRKADGLQDFQRAGLNAGGTAVMGRPVVLIDDPAGNAMPIQLSRHEQARWTCAHHQYLGVSGHQIFDRQQSSGGIRGTGVTEYWIGFSRQSALMFAARITLPHFSVSSAISLPNWAGDPGSGVPPRSARRAFILGSSRAALTSLLSWSTISAGVAFGTPRPYQLLPS